MPGLAEILAENERLRQQLATGEEAARRREVEHQAELEAWQRKHAEQGVKLDAVHTRAEQLAQALEMIRLRRRGPASQRYIPDEQAAFPFPADLIVPPRLAQPQPADGGQGDDHGTTAAKPKRTRGTPKRRNLDKNTELPRRTVRCPAPEDQACNGCGKPVQVIGQARSHRVEWVPGHFVIEEVLRDKCACPDCPGEGVLTVPGPYALERAMCGDGLLARVIVDKFCDHIPLNRQARRIAREGFEVRSNTLSGWVGQGARWAKVIAEAVRRELLQGSFLQGDDTGHPVQDGGNGQLRKGRLWVFTDQQQAFYAFTPTKQGVYPVALLDGFAGDLLLADAGSEFNEVVRTQGLERAGCWSHLRTYFWDARHHHPVEAKLALGTICDLFFLERTFAGEGPDEVLTRRRAKSKPLVDGFFQWVNAVSTTVRLQSTLSAALTYAQNQEAALRVHLDHGELPMHNNLSELMLRQPVVGRKNWLFSRTEGGAHGAAAYYTLVGSCMLQGVDPHDYLVDVLRRVQDHPANRVAELTPRAWRLARESHTTAAA